MGKHRNKKNVQFETSNEVIQEEADEVVQEEAKKSGREMSRLKSIQLQKEKAAKLNGDVDGTFKLLAADIINNEAYKKSG